MKLTNYIFIFLIISLLNVLSGCVPSSRFIVVNNSSQDIEIELSIHKNILNSKSPHYFLYHLSRNVPHEKLSLPGPLAIIPFKDPLNVFESKYSNPSNWQILKLNEVRYIPELQKIVYKISPKTAFLVKHDQIMKKFYQSIHLKKGTSTTGMEEKAVTDELFFSEEVFKQFVEERFNKKAFFVISSLCTAAIIIEK